MIEELASSSNQRVESTTEFTGLAHKAKNDNTDDNQTDSNNTSGIDFLIVKKVRYDGDGRNANTRPDCVGNSDRYCIKCERKKIEGCTIADDDDN